MPTLEQNLKLAFELSQEILRLAGEEQWSELEQLDHKRMQTLKVIFADPEASSSEGFEERVQQIVALNDRTLAICEAARVDVMKDGKKLKLGRDAIQAYRKQAQD
ncbi:flagellar protein FliT [Candidatus Thiodiazotropha sp. CDECU1]|uniref:flagellar protein FliT n=1 Tax=Candidatus Thiodiazotropha sp. CDECU1 TaxID=3065865 RepID=UPI00292E936D|nr:flagellar protein FliT [Candidatus Thiodiazotropha sp. CDECU1]